MRVGWDFCQNVVGVDGGRHDSRCMCMWGGDLEGMKCYASLFDFFYCFDFPFSCLNEFENFKL